MTAAEAAAQYAQAKAGAPGVFSLSQLAALGQSGNVNADYLKASVPKPGALIAGGGGAVLTAKGLQAGYYQVPGQQGAEYYDPHFGQASQAFVDWANSLTPDQFDPFTGQPPGFIPAEGGPQAANAARADQSAAGIAATNAIIAGGKGADGTYQASMDRQLGTGPNQQFMLDRGGKQVRVADVVTAARGASMDRSGAAYIDLSTHPSMFKLVAPIGGTGQSQWQYVTPPAGTAIAGAVPYSAVAEDIQASIDANAQHNQDAYSGLQQERIIRAAIAAGQDPGDALKAAMAGDARQIEIANSGISAAQQKQIYETYGRISDPAEKAAYISMQDPGNLVGKLRAARDTARQGQVDWMTKNQLAPVKTYESALAYGAASDSGTKQNVGGVVTTFGDITQTDKTTGRSIMFGNVPVSRSFIAPQNNGLDLSVGGKTLLSKTDVNRINGGVQLLMGALVTGGILGLGTAALAATSLTSAYIGAGGYLPNARNISFKNSTGWGQWKSGEPQQLTPTGFLLGLGVGAVMQGVGAFVGKYFSSAATATAVKATPSFMAKFGMPAVLSGLQLESAAKGRQGVEDMMTKKRQRTGP